MLTWVMNEHSHTLMWVATGHSHMLTFSTLPLASFWFRSEHCKIPNHSEIQDEQSVWQSLNRAPDVNTMYRCWRAEFAILHTGALCDYWAPSSLCTKILWATPRLAMGGTHCCSLEGLFSVTPSFLFLTPSTWPYLAAYRPKARLSSQLLLC